MPRKYTRPHPNWPAPHEIAALAAEIRAKWSPQQTRLRAGLPDDNSVSIPVISRDQFASRRSANDRDEPV